MQRLLHLVALVSVLALPTLMSGCASSAVGDPCDPENVPPGGFNASEAYLETSSVQCRTRVCMVYHLAGDPGGDCDPTVDTCPGSEAIDQRVYCTCRCDAPAGSNTPTCGCPGGFTCAEVLQLGGRGIRGSYCVKDVTLGSAP